MNLSSFTENRFWLLINNNEPAYNSCNTGAPDTSLPRYAPGIGGPFGSAPVMDTGAGENFYRAHLVMNYNYGNPCGPADGIPYMAIGGHANRGNKSVSGTSYNLAALNPTAGIPHHVGYTAKLFDYATPTAAAFRLMFVASWPNLSGLSTPRMLFVNMLHQNINDSDNLGPHRMLWNWAITANTFYPGAEVVYFDAEDVRLHCKFDVFQMTGTTSGDIHYDIDVHELFRCASRTYPTTINPPPLENVYRGFTNAMPSTPNIPVTMIDWAVEGQSVSGYIWPAVSNMHTH